MATGAVDAPVTAATVGDGTLVDIWKRQSRRLGCPLTFTEFAIIREFKSRPTATIKGPDGVDTVVVATAVVH